MSESEKKQQAKVVMFDPAGIIRKSQRIQEITDPDLGLVRFVPLPWKDIVEIKKKNPTDNMEAAIQMVYHMLAPVNPGMTLETVKLLPIDVVTRLMILLCNKNGFLAVKPNQALEAVGLPKGDAK